MLICLQVTSTHIKCLEKKFRLNEHTVKFMKFSTSFYVMKILHTLGFDLRGALSAYMVQTNVHTCLKALTLPKYS